MKIKEDVFYVGVCDESLKNFDVFMQLNHGTTYNSYLVKGNDKIALIDTVKEEFTDEFISNIEQYVSVKEIDYLIVNHSEPDHSGAVKRILELNPEIEVCGTKMAIDFIRNIINFDFKSKVLTANDSLDLGQKEMKFFAFPMLHWPDSMLTYLKEDNMIFTCDSFGVHYATKKMYNDLEPEMIDEYKYYFDSILGPFKKPFLSNALNKISLIPLDYICPGHGMIIRKDVQKYLETYREWCEYEEVKRPKITVCYISSYGYTKKIAEALVEGLNKVEEVDVKLYNLEVDNLETIKKDILESKGIIMGSPTILADALPQVYDVLTCLNSIVNRGVTGLAFGSYAWSGEAVDNINNCFRMLRFKTEEPIRIKLNPSEYDIEQIVSRAEQFARKILE